MKELKNMLYEFCSLFGNCLCVICLMLAGFNILINVYHSNEIKDEYYTDFNTSEDFINYKSSIDSYETKLNSVKYSGNDQNQSVVMSLFKDQLLKCISKVKESKYYKIDNQLFSLTNIYDYNNDLSSNLITSCLFSPNYNLKTSLTTYNLNLNYPLFDEIDESKENLIYYSNYLRDMMLGNGSYHYTTENSKISIYNEVQQYFELNNTNYNVLEKNIGKMVNWYISSIGGEIK